MSFPNVVNPIGVDIPFWLVETIPNIIYIEIDAGIADGCYFAGKFE